MSKHRWLMISALISALSSSAWSQAPENEDGRLQTIAATLQARCVACHGASKQEGGYRLDTFSRLRLAGDSDEPAIFPGEPDRSELFLRVSSHDPDVRMPPEGPELSVKEIELLRTWITEGAKTSSEQDELPLASLSSMAGRRRIPEKYPAPLPVTAIALEATEAGPQKIWTSGYGEVLQWELNIGALPDEIASESKTTDSLSSSKLVSRLAVTGEHVSKLSISYDLQLMAVASGTPGYHGAVEVFPLANVAAPASWFTSDTDLAGDIAFSPKTNRLAIGKLDGSLLMVDLTASLPPTQQHSIVPHADAILCVAWSPDGERLITGSRDRTAKLFQAPQLDLIANYDRHERAVGGVSFVDSQPLTFDETGRLRLWTGDDNDKTIAETDTRVRFLESVTANDGHIYVCDGGSVRTYEIERQTIDDGQDDAGKPKKKNVTRLKSSTQYQSNSSAWLLSVSTDHGWLTAGSEAGDVFVWKVGETEPIWRFRATP